MEHVGQSGTIPDLPRAYSLNAAAIVEAVEKGPRRPGFAEV